MAATSSATPSRSLPLPPPPSFASLPPALAHTVFAFAVGTHPAYQRNASPVAPGLQTFAQVSRDWHRLARDAASEATLARLYISCYDARHFFSCRSGMLELRRRALLRRAYVRELVVETLYFNDAPFVLTGDEWNAVLRCLPSLHVLDLAQVPRDNVRRIGLIVMAAGLACRQLEKLLLPAVPQLGDAYTNASIEIDEHPSDTAALVNVVLQALERWHAHGTQLRELRLPIEFTKWGRDHVSASTAYVAFLAKTCPRIERISSRHEIPQRIDEWTSTEQWLLDEVTWTTFCANCPQLKAFDWVVVPFATRFFEIFGCYAKPQLEQLTLSTAMNWDWPHYLEAHGLPPDAKGYAATAQHPERLLTACPNLKALTIPTYSYGDTPEPEPEYLLEQLARMGQRHRPRMAACRPMMDHESLGDAFVEALTLSCPRLEELSIKRVWLELPAVNVTGAGVFALLTDGTRSDWSWQREVQLMIGDRDSRAFYDELDRLFRLLIAWDHDGPSTPFVLTVRNGKFAREEAAWSRAYLVRLRALVAVVQCMYPTFKMCVLMLRYENQGDAATASFAMIVSFAFVSVNAGIRRDYEWADESQLQRLDDVFAVYAM